MDTVASCISWLKSTFLLERIKCNPTYYKLPVGHTEAELDEHMKELCVRHLRELASSGMIALADDGIGLEPLRLGRITARYCVELETMRRFKEGLRPESNVEELAHTPSHTLSSNSLTP